MNIHCVGWEYNATSKQSVGGTKAHEETVCNCSQHAYFNTCHDHSVFNVCDFPQRPRGCLEVVCLVMCNNQPKIKQGIIQQVCRAGADGAFQRDIVNLMAH